MSKALNTVVQGLSKVQVYTVNLVTTWEGRVHTVSKDTKEIMNLPKLYRCFSEIISLFKDKGSSLSNILAIKGWITRFWDGSTCYYWASTLCWRLDLPKLILRFNRYIFPRRKLCKLVSNSYNLLRQIYLTMPLYFCAFVQTKPDWQTFMILD